MKITKIEAVKALYNFTDDEAKRFIKEHPELIDTIVSWYKSMKAIERH